MSNHFHLLLEEPRDSGEVLAEDEVLRRFGALNGKSALAELRAELKRLREEAKEPEKAEEMLGRIRARMGDVSIFVKELKERFAQWYNRTERRIGALWAGRFRSVIVEGGGALLTVARYIDLNPIRAGLVEDPKDYKWCGYAEAVGAGGKVGKRAREGLRALFVTLPGKVGGWEKVPWSKVLGSYRAGLYFDGQESREGRQPGDKPGFDRKKAAEVIESGGRLSATEALHCRVRYFTDGMALGSEAFVEKLFGQHRGAFGPKRKRGSRKMRGVPWEELRTMRDLRKEPLSA